MYIMLMYSTWNTIDSKHWFRYTLNQLLFTTSLFRDLPKKIWFAAIKFRDLNEDFLKNIIAKTF